MRVDRIQHARRDALMRTDDSCLRDELCSLGVNNVNTEYFANLVINDDFDETILLANRDRLSDG